MESQYAPLSEACAKTLWDKTYDKRKIAATEIEKYILITFELSNRSHSMNHNHSFRRMVIEFNTTKNYNQIRKLINVLGQDLATSRDNNKRKGGLLGLAATSIGLGRVSITCRNENHHIMFDYPLCSQDTDKFVEELVTPVLNCLSDPEVRVRYFASESLYNIVKVARSSIIPLFPRIFSALSRLVTGKILLRCLQT